MIDLTLPFPPSGNSRNKIGRRGVYRSAKTQKYYDACRFIVHQKQFKIITHEVELHIHTNLPDKRRRDADNIEKTLFDALQYAGVLTDDSLIKRHVHDFDKQILKGGSVEMIFIPYEHKKKFWAVAKNILTNLY